jgi:hypothetical protein
MLRYLNTKERHTIVIMILETEQVHTLRRRYVLFATKRKLFGRKTGMTAKREGLEGL